MNVNWHNLHMLISLLMRKHVIRRSFAIEIFQRNKIQLWSQFTSYYCPKAIALKLLKKSCQNEGSNSHRKNAKFVKNNAFSGITLTFTTNLTSETGRSAIFTLETTFLTVLSVEIHSTERKHKSDPLSSQQCHLNPLAAQ